MDHIGGASAVIREMRVKSVVFSQEAEISEAEKDLIVQAKLKKAILYSLKLEITGQKEIPYFKFCLHLEIGWGTCIQGKMIALLSFLPKWVALTGCLPEIWRKRGKVSL
nr:hypothetical protein [Cytobacillus pseudoceanisediminis]